MARTPLCAFHIRTASSTDPVTMKLQSGDAATAKTPPICASCSVRSSAPVAGPGCGQQRAGEAWGRRVCSESDPCGVLRGVGLTRGCQQLEVQRWGIRKAMSFQNKCLYIPDLCKPVDIDINQQKCHTKPILFAAWFAPQNAFCPIIGGTLWSRNISGI